MNITSDMAKTAKNLAQKAAQQVVQEPLEILRQSGRQVTGIENQSETASPEVPETPQNNQVSPGEKAKMEVQGQRQLQALEAELKDIRVRNVQKEQVITQQEQMRAQQTEEKKPLVEPSPKKGRQLGGTPGHVKKQQTHIERLQPPSG